MMGMACRRPRSRQPIRQNQIRRERIAAADGLPDVAEATSECDQVSACTPNARERLGQKPNRRVYQ